MPDLTERHAQRLVETLVDLRLTADKLSQHSTVASNQVLRERVNHVRRRTDQAAMLTCLCFCPRDTLSDLDRTILDDPPAPAFGCLWRPRLVADVENERAA